MKLERSNVEFPLWRKKVDKSLFETSQTPIPGWASDIWGLPDIFGRISSKRDPNSVVSIRFKSKKYKGWVRIAKPNAQMRLSFEEELAHQLKQQYVMSYMRSLEQSLSEDRDAEENIPFWEFLDIEFDASKREFKFVAHYYQIPSFPNLFERLIGSPSLKKIDDELHGKEARVQYQDWLPKAELENQLGAQNVVYLLIDTKRKLLYVGETVALVERLNQTYPVIPHWDWFRYNVLPAVLEPYRVTLERMLIRNLATLFPNKRHKNPFQLSDYKLVNEKIDA